MNENEKPQTRIITPEFRVSFPAVFQPRGMEGQQAKYQITMLFPSDYDLSALKKCAVNALSIKWPDATKRPKGLRSPFQKGDEKEYDGYKGMIVVKATAIMRPKLVDADLQPIMDEEQFYAGCYARAAIRFYAYEKSGNRGVSCSFDNVQKLRDGEKFGGGRTPEEDFGAPGAKVRKQTDRDDFPDGAVPEDQMEAPQEPDTSFP